MSPPDASPLIGRRLVVTLPETGERPVIIATFSR